MEVYAIVGESTQYIGADHPAGAIKMSGERPSPYMVAVADGTWAEPVPSEIEVRAERDRLLAESDWTQLADAPLTDEEKTAWAAKRQALRDVPQQGGFPWAVAWPE